MEPELEIGTTPDDTRQRIVTAALGLFGQVGYTRATTRTIAEEAGVNEVTLFRHFGSKKNLLMACMQAFNETSFPGVFESGLTGDYAADILHMALQQIEDTRANLDMLRVMLCDARVVPELREVLMAGARGNLTRLSRYFQRQIDAGVVRKALSADTLAFSFDSLFSTSLLFENLFGEAITPQLGGEDTVLLLVDLFVRGTQAEERIS
jgi:AcrR family transcriptional regulator